MDFVPSSILPVRTPKNVLWVGTYYQSIPNNIANMRTDIVWKSEKIKLAYVYVLVEFQFQRYSELEFRLTCIRTPLDVRAFDFIPDYGYSLQFHCSVSVFDDGPKVFEIVGDQSIAFATFWLNDSYPQCFLPSYLQEQFELKILVRMLEYDDLPTYDHLRQEDEFHVMRLKFFNFKPVLDYILKCPAVRGIFTGRQDYYFAELKNNLIRRTATYAREIADYLQNKYDNMPLPLTNLPLILNYILKGEKIPISNNDVIQVYLAAHLMGLNYLADISRDCILERIENQNFVIDALHAADRVNDEILFENIARNFHGREEEILNTERWLEMLEHSNVICPFILYSLKRRLRKYELQCRPGTASALESSSFKIF